MCVGGRVVDVLALSEEVFSPMGCGILRAGGGGLGRIRMWIGILTRWKDGS